MKARSALRAIGISFMLSGALGLTLNTLVVDYAYANNGNGGGGNGGGNGGGGGGGNGGGGNGGDSAGNGGDRGNSANSNRGGNGKAHGKNNGNGNGKGKSEGVGASLKKFFGIKTQKSTQKAAKNVTSKRTAVSKSKLERVGKQPTNVSMRPPTKGVRPKASQGSIASELKALNAAHASINGLTNAAPGSMPGMLNSYRVASIDEAEKVAALNEAVLKVEDAKTNEMGARDAAIDAQIMLDQAEAALDDVTEEDENFEKLSQDVVDRTKALDDAKMLADTAAQDLFDAQVAETKAAAEADKAKNVTEEAFEALPGSDGLSVEALEELKNLLGLKTGDGTTDDSANLYTEEDAENDVF